MPVLPEITESPTLVDLYLRLSDARNEKGSFAEREAKLREHAQRRGWAVTRVVIENDEMPGGSKSASAFKRRRITLPDGRIKVRVYRPGFRSVLDDLAHGRAHALLAEDLDRVLRDPRDLEDLIDVCREHRVSADSLSGSLRFTNGGTDAEHAMARVMVAMANKSSSDTARRVAAARERKATNGEWGGGKRPYGFEADGVTVRKVVRLDDGAIPDDDGETVERELPSKEIVKLHFSGEAAEIIRAADALLGGVSMRALALDLRKRNVPTVKGTRWTAETLKDILVRPRNAGIVVYRPETQRRRGGARKPAGRYYTKDDERGRAPWEPILDENTWRTLVAKLIDPNRQPGKPGPAHKWLGSGIYLCICGATMQVLKKGDKVSPAYRCRETGSGAGARHTVRNVTAVDALVVDSIVEYLSQPEAANLLAAPAEQAVDLAAVRRQIAGWRQKLLTYADDEREDRITREQFLHNTRILKGKIAAAQTTLAEHSVRSPLAPLIGAKDVRQVWDGLSLGAQREIVKELMDVKILEAKRRGRSPFDPKTVQITWKK
ncbi:recombinase family protein [Dactylosporangium sp. CA-092794]|uniref:recombinase family protein n=1 Tax=Dactylosporangium sp. CA-092794 TaxID=3239929 RepID=UPI003D8FFDD5